MTARTRNSLMPMVNKDVFSLIQDNKLPLWSVFQKAACFPLPWLCMRFFNHRWILKLPRYPACFGAAVEISGCVTLPRLSLLDELGPGQVPGVSPWRPVQKITLPSPQQSPAVTSPPPHVLVYTPRTRLCDTHYNRTINESVQNISSVFCVEIVSQN